MPYHRIPLVNRPLKNNNFREYNKKLRPWAKHRILAYMYYKWKMNSLGLVDSDQVTVKRIINMYHRQRLLLLKRPKSEERVLERAFVKLMARGMVRRHGKRKKYYYSLTKDGLQKAKYIWNNCEEFGIDVYPMEKQIGARWWTYDPDYCRVMRLDP